MSEDGLPCDTCGGPGWIFGGGYGLVSCADCNDDERTPRPRPSLRFILSRPPEPWADCDFGRYYECGQCKARAQFVQWSRAGPWWVCHCLAAAETATGVVVLKFPQPERVA